MMKNRVLTAGGGAIGLALLVTFVLAVSSAAESSGAARAPGKQARARLDPGFGTHGRVIGPAWTYWDAPVFAARDPEGRILVATESQVLRYLPGGQLDPSFAQGGVLQVPNQDFAEKHFRLAAIAVDSEGRLLLAGRTFQRPVTGPGGTYSPLPNLVTVIRYTPQGSLDLGFGSAGFEEGTFGLPAAAEPFNPSPQNVPQPQVTSIAVDREGRIVVGGIFPTVLGMCKFATVGRNGQFVARLTANGAPDPAFGGGDGVTTNADLLYASASIAPDRNGGLLLAGSYRDIFCGFERQGEPVENLRGSVRRLFPNGEPDTRFGVGGTRIAGEGVRQLAVDRSGRIVLLLGPPSMTRLWEIADTTRLIRLDPGGAYDRRFGPDQNGRVTLQGRFDAMTLDSRGRILLTGSTTAPLQAPSRFVLMRLLRSGRPDRSVGPGGRIKTGFGANLSRPEEILLDDRGRPLLVGTITGAPLSFDQPAYVAMSRYLLPAR